MWRKPLADSASVTYASCAGVDVLRKSGRPLRAKWDMVRLRSGDENRFGSRHALAIDDENSRCDGRLRATRGTNSARLFESCAVLMGRGRGVVSVPDLRVVRVVPMYRRHSLMMIRKYAQHPRNRHGGLERHCNQQQHQDEGVYSIHERSIASAGSKESNSILRPEEAHLVLPNNRISRSRALRAKSECHIMARPIRCWQGVRLSLLRSGIVTRYRTQLPSGNQAHRAVLEFGNLPERIEGRIGEQVGCRFVVGKGNEYRAARRAAVGART